MEKGPIGPVLLNFALPVLLSQLLQELYNATDCMVVGHYAGPYALAATGVAGLVLSVLINFFIGFSSGISAITARLFGAYDHRTLRRTLNAVFRLVLAVGLTLSCLGLAGASWVLRMLRCPAEVLPEAAAYLRICAPGLAAQLMYNVGTAVLRSLGDTRTPLRMQLVSVGCNLALDALLVIVLRQGVAGAAWATLASQWLLCLLLWRRLRGLDGRYALRLTGESLSRRELGRILSVGLPAGMQALFMSISSLLIQTVINGFGPAAMAGMTVFAKLEGVVYLPSFAYGIALTGFVGQNLGAGRTDRIRSAVGLSLRVMTAVILPLSLALTVAAPALLRVFTHDEAVLRNACEAVRFILPCYLFYAANQVYLGAVKGLGDTGWPMVCTLLCYSLFRVAWCRALIGAFPTMRVVYLSYDVSFVLMLALLWPVWRRRLRDAEAKSRSLPHDETAV